MPSGRAHLLIPCWLSPMSCETPFPYLSCSFTKTRFPVHLGSSPQWGSPCCPWPLRPVCKAALQETDGGNKARHSLRIWSPATLAQCTLAFAAFVQAESKAIVGHLGEQSRSWANTPERRHVAAERRRQEAAPGNSHMPHSQSGDQIPRGLRLRGMALRTKLVFWNESPVSPETQGSCL